jgi:imidazolonepropionase-like amidohydrolase
MEKEKKDHDEKNEVLSRVLRGEIPMFVNVFAPREIESMLELAEKYAIRLVICGAYGIKNSLERVLAAGHHVVMGDFTYLLEFIKHDTDLELLLQYYRKGLKLSLATSNDTAYPAGYEQILWSAAMMYRAGATPKEVLEMITINPASALGVDKLVGTIEKGKRADLILCHGNPITRYDSYVAKSIVAGSIAYQRA